MVKGVEWVYRIGLESTARWISFPNRSESVRCALDVLAESSMEFLYRVDGRSSRRALGVSVEDSAVHSNSVKLQIESICE